MLVLREREHIRGGCPLPQRTVLYTQGLGAPGDTYVFLTHHLSLHSPAQNSWDGNVPLALKEHRENETSLLSSAGFWRLLAANTVSAHAVALGVVCVVCMEQMAPPSSNEKQEEEEVAPWRETSINVRINEAAPKKSSEHDGSTTSALLPPQDVSSEKFPDTPEAGPTTSEAVKHKQEVPSVPCTTVTTRFCSNNFNCSSPKDKDQLQKSGRFLYPL